MFGSCSVVRIGTWTRKLALRMVLMAWNLYTCQVIRETLKSRVQELAKYEKEAQSLWKMCKADLVQVARQELGMTIAQAEAETVTTLREKIRRQREVLKADENPFQKVPKGLEKMPLAALMEEANLRQLAIPPKATRPALIVAIRDDVAQRSLLSTTTPTASTSNPNATGPNPMEDDEYQIVNNKRQAA